MVGLLIVAFIGYASSSSCVVVLGDLRLDEGDLVLGQPVPLVELGVSPLLVQRQVGYESVDVLRVRPAWTCGATQGSERNVCASSIA